MVIKNTPQPKRGRPVGTIKPRRDYQVLQMRMFPPALERFERARSKTALNNRSEFMRILLDEALKARGF